MHVSGDNLEAVKFLIEYHSDIDAKDGFGNTPLWRCVINKKPNIEIVHILLKHGADPALIRAASFASKTICAIPAISSSGSPIANVRVRSEK